MSGKGFLEENKGMIGVASLAIGLGSGIVTLARIAAGLMCYFMPDDGGHSEQVKEDKRNWWKSLTSEDKKAFKIHECRKKEYIKLRQRLYDEVRRRCYVDFNRALPPTSTLRDYRQQQIANEVWREWKMDDWNDVRKFPDYDSIKFQLSRTAVRWNSRTSGSRRRKPRSGWSTTVASGMRSP
jgi:hypothetical protein